MKTIALHNIKGGVGKTTSAVNLAWLAASSGLKTTLWDLDPQGCASFYLGVDAGEVKQRAGRLIEGKLEPTELRLPSAYENLSVVPADFSLRKLDLLLAEESKGHFKALLKSLGTDQQLVILDCAPALSSTAEQLFRAVDIVLVPLIPTPLSLRAYEQLKEFTAQKKWTEVKLVPFFTQVDRRRKLQSEIVESRRRRFPEMLKSYIPYASAAEQMGTHRAPLNTFAASSAPGLAYSLLWNEVKKLLRNS